MNLLILLLAYTPVSQAQELNAHVTINSEHIQGTDKAVFKSMEIALNQLINQTQWGYANFTANERIDCIFSLMIKQFSDNTFTAELLVQARRPVYNAAYTTMILNCRDTEIEFEYTENETLHLQDNVLANNLVAVISFYTNLILALDFDSFSNMGGSVFFRQSGQIANMAQSHSNWKGWSTFDDKSKSSMIDVFLDESLKKYRELWYTYHRRGLDEMAANPDRGRTTILNILSYLKDLRQIRSSDIVIQMFADTKLEEVISIAEKANREEKKELYDLFYNLYPTMSDKFESLKR